MSINDLRFVLKKYLAGSDCRKSENDLPVDMCCKGIDLNELGVSAVGVDGRVTGFCIVRMNWSVIVISASECKDSLNHQTGEPNTHDHPCPTEPPLGNARVSNLGMK